MLARADDERVLRLHPDDLALIAGQLPEGLPVLADPVLERGGLRVETSNGGVEDGPEQWRRAIAEALSACRIQTRLSPSPSGEGLGWGLS